jgi:hypothetical protein
MGQDPDLRRLMRGGWRAHVPRMLDDVFGIVAGYGHGSVVGARLASTSGRTTSPGAARAHGLENLGDAEPK